MSAGEDKKILRRQLMYKKLNLKDSEGAAYSKTILNTLSKYVNWEKIDSLHMYLPIERNNEIDTWPLIDIALKNSPTIDIYLPKADGYVLFEDKAMLEQNALGIPEPMGAELSQPAMFDLIILPVVGFDRNGYRLGYGGGYYDKFLAKNRCKQIIGLAYSFCELPEIPAEAHDQRMQTIITEREIITVNSSSTP